VERKLVCQGFAYRPLVGVANLSFGDPEANQAPVLARIRQEKVLFSAPEADVDEDVVFADLGRLKHLEAEPLLARFVGLRARDGVPVIQELAVLLADTRQSIGLLFRWAS
jgi:hypothetical protein